MSKNPIHKLIASIVNRLSQGSVKEVEDGITSSAEMASLCRNAVAEGCVLLKNEGVLPLADKKFALFGRCQVNTFYVGYGSGGDVKPPYRVSILDGLDKGGANLDKKVAERYRQWTKKHPPDDGYWGNWPMCYDEMPVDEQFISSAAQENEIAVVVIGRAAGEDRENREKRGSWFLATREEKLLALTKKHFKKVCVLLNCGSIMDIVGIQRFSPDAIMFVWQGGQEMGNGVADVLLGKVSPSGKLTDTLAKIEDYPSYKYFGNKKYNEYAEDIYVGYRYFNTFAEDKIIYPFGFGLSYTTFAYGNCNVTPLAECKFEVSFTVKNTGIFRGKEVAQVYLSAPQAKLGKPSKELVAYVKTGELSPSGQQVCTVKVDLAQFASYDDSGATGHRNCFVLEEGEYKLFLGTSVSDNREIWSGRLSELVVKQCEEACAPRTAFKRMINDGKCTYEDVPTAAIDLRGRILARLPKKVEKNSEIQYRLQDVASGAATLDEFIAQFTPEQLEAITRGSLSMMNSPYGPMGNAGTFGGNCEQLFAMGIPALSTNDGPSGIRLQAHSTLLPNGVALASAFNDALVEQLAYQLGKEVRERGSHVLLAPGMNIHRNPLCGRNFEYFSEDPYLTGKIAAAYVRGVQRAGASATPKHFACNNQEKGRSINDSRVSQRALREIYLKGFAICIKESNPDCLMTSYNKLNGVWNCYNYDLVTTILRAEWGYEGVVMTDWWMKSAACPFFSDVETQAYRVRSQVDVFMPGAANFGKYRGRSDGSILRSLSSRDGLTIGELQRSAKNVLKLCLNYI